MKLVLRSDVDQAYDWGVGARYALTRTIDLRVDAKHVIVRTYVMKGDANKALAAAREVAKLDPKRGAFEVEETLASLSHVPKAIVTNKPYEFSVALLEGLGMLSQFNVVLGGDSLPERKPSPMMLLEAARSIGVPPSACLMVGDTKFDVMAGQAAGMKTCGYIPGFRGRTELAEAGADFLIERFSELCVLVECAKTHFAGSLVGR